MTPQGIFAIETGDWWGSYRVQSSVRPILDLVSHGTRGVAYVHRRASTKEELAHHVRLWKRTKRFPLLFLSCHGERGRLYLGHLGTRRELITLDELAEMIGPGCEGRLIHLGACSTLAVDRRHVTRFLRRTGMVAATGFKNDVDWLRSSAFEVLLLATLLRYRLTLAGARRIERALKRESPRLRRELGLRVVIR